MTSKNSARARSASRKTSNKKGKKSDAQVNGQNAVPEEVPDQPVFEESKNPFERLEQLWDAKADLEAQRQLVADLFEMPQGPPHSMQSILLDDVVAHAMQARQARMNSAQTEAFFDIMDEVKRKCAEGVDLRENFACFKQRVLDNSTLKRSMADVIKEEENRLAALKPPPPEPSTLNPPKSDRSSKGTKTDRSQKGKKKGKEVEQEAPPPPPPPNPLVNPLFSPDMIKQMTDYVATGIFGHYNLHRCLLNTASFTPSKKVLVAQLRVNSIVPDRFSLETAVDLDLVRAAEQARREQEEEMERQRLAAEAVAPKTEMEKLVARQLEKVRTSMEDQLRLNQEALDSKFQAIAKHTGGK